MAGFHLGVVSAPALGCGLALEVELRGYECFYAVVCRACGGYETSVFLFLKVHF
jgi:hypothetical protein